jgi:transposase-like protein
MPKSRKPYPPEYRAKSAALANAGRTVEELATEFDASH